MPLILIWGVAIPVIFLYTTRRVKDVNDTPSLRLKYSFLIKGYNERD